jgi:excisionase family DNA binding protein
VDLLTVKEIAQLLRVSPITVRRYIASGRLPAVRIGRGVRIDRTSAMAACRPYMNVHDGEVDWSRVRPFTFDDPIWDIVGMIDDTDGPTDLAVNHDRYLAEAFDRMHRR